MCTFTVHLHLVDAAKPAYSQEFRVSHSLQQQGLRALLPASARCWLQVLNQPQHPNLLSTTHRRQHIAQREIWVDIHRYSYKWHVQWRNLVNMVLLNYHVWKQKCWVMTFCTFKKYIVPLFVAPYWILSILQYHLLRLMGHREFSPSNLFPQTCKGDLVSISNYYFSPKERIGFLRISAFTKIWGWHESVTYSWHFFTPLQQEGDIQHVTYQQKHPFFVRLS